MVHINSKNHILLVESEKKLSEGVKRLLEMDGAKVTAADNFMDAKKLVAAEPNEICIFDIIVIDVEKHGDKSWEDETRYIREHCKSARFVATTSYIDDALFMEKLNCEFNSVIAKPYAASDLIKGLD